MALSSVAALSSNAEATTNKGVLPIRVKQERPDEAEIRELAAKMVEANKAKMASTPRPGGQAGQVSQTPTQLVQPGQPGIMNYLTRSIQQGKPNDKDKKTVSNNEGDKKPPCDEESARGKFGWVTLGKCHIPFIFRYGEKFCAVRMVESKLLNKYLNFLHSDIYSCTCIRSYYITDIEARLLNEINVKHCEGQFGRETFSPKDLVVRLQDAGEFYNFLDVCYNKLILCSTSSKDKCGFIRINGDSVVPYTVRDGYKYVPLFYFEGETDNLKLKAEKLESWDLAYLKFCCKVQGIRNELFASETCSVISVNDIKSYFPPGTVFEDYWPSKVVDNQLLLATGKGVASAGLWTKQPVVPPHQQHSVTNSAAHHQVTTTSKVVTTTPTPQARTPVIQPTAPVAPAVNSNPVTVQAMCNGWASGLVGGQSAYQPEVIQHANQIIQQANQVIRMTQAAPISMHNLSSTVNSTSRSYNPLRPRPGHQYYPQVSLPMQLSTQTQNHMAVAQPPPLVRVTGAPPTIGSSGTYTSSPGLSLPNVSASSLHLMGLNDPSHHAMLPPPPHTSSLLHAHSTSHSPHYSPSVMGTSQSQQRHTPPNNKFPPPPLIPVNGTSRYSSNIYNADVIDLSSPPPSPHRPTVGNGRSSSSSSSSGSAPDPSRHKLIQIAETPTTGTHNPYQVQKALVEGKMVPCINAKPFIYSELLMTLQDLGSTFFPSNPVACCRQVLQEVLGVDLYRGNRQQMTILRESGKCQSTQDMLPLVQVRDVMQYMPQMKYILENPQKRQRTS